jgi:hypothetical protein
MRYAPLATTLLVAACGGAMPEVRPLPMTAQSVERSPFAEAYQAGKDHLMADRVGLAIVMFERALAIDPVSVAALNALGAAYDELHRPDLAKTYYLRALVLEPDGADTLNNMAISAAVAGDPAASRQFLARAAALDPGNATIRGNVQVASARPREISESGSDEDPIRPRIERTGLVELTLKIPANSSAPRDGGTPMDIAYAMPAANRDPLAPMGASFMPVAVPADWKAASIDFAAPAAARPARAGDRPTLEAVQLAALAGGQIDLAGLMPQARAPRAAVTRETLAAPVGAEAEPRREIVVAAAAPVAVGVSAVLPADADRPADATTKPDHPRTPAPFRCRIEVSNGAGRNGMARRVRDYLANHGVVARRLTNAASFDHAETVLFHRPDAADQAREMAELLPDAIVLKAEPELDCAVRLQLGRDLLPFDENLSRPNHEAP